MFNLDNENIPDDAHSKRKSGPCSDDSLTNQLYENK
jgi:hypothetical protein